ncbi:MAG: glutathione S-transferase family protein [Alphaproteobacteria bacterium]
MKQLHHYCMSPFCRKVRIMLAEKREVFSLIEQKPWRRSIEFLKVDPSGEVPVLIEDNGVIVPDHNAICEYLDEQYGDTKLIGSDPLERAEVRRIVSWFDRKFYNEVFLNIVGEKLIKRLSKSGSPDSRFIAAGKKNIHVHLDYISWLIERRRWIAGTSFSLADIAAAAHLSVVDYLGDVPWNDHIEAKNWYARIKSRPTFRDVLSDKIVGLDPQPDYENLDF